MPAANRWIVGRICFATNARWSRPDVRVATQFSVLSLLRLICQVQNLALACEASRPSGTRSLREEQKQEVTRRTSDVSVGSGACGLPLGCSAGYRACRSRRNRRWRVLAAALVLGADGVLVGTRFLASTEALIPPSSRATAVAADGDSTVRDRAVDLSRRMGWPEPITGRVLKTRFTKD